MISSAAMADDVQAMKERFYENQAACRMGEMNGKPISQAESEQSCGKLEQYATVLKKAGQCWNGDEQEWSACQ